MKYRIQYFIYGFLLVWAQTSIAQKNKITLDAEEAMLKATKYMVERVSANGGYVGVYLPDLTRRWGEMEAYKTQVWIGGNIPFTQNMGNVFLNAYDATGNEYYYDAAQRVARALIWGQLPSGGWDHIVDFAGNQSLEKWYSTIGRNAWGWDEYNHYYGTATFKANSIISATRFLLRLYLKKLDPAYKPVLDKAINFILSSQYPLGGWPQRYPQRADKQFQFGGKSEYTSFYIFNDDVSWQNLEFLIQCYQTLGEERFLDPIRRGMNFYLITQQGNPQGGWAQQYDMDLKPAHARQYEPASLSPGDTYRIAELLMKFYRYTGDRKFLARIPDAIQWLENCRLPQSETENGQYSHPIFVEVGTNKALYAHRKGHSISDGHYWIDYNSDNPLLHYGAKQKLDIDKLNEEYKRLNALSPDDATKNSPLKIQSFEGDGMPQNCFDLKVATTEKAPDKSEVNRIIKSLDKENRWLSKHEWISRPYMVSETGVESNTALLSTEGGSLIRDTSEQQYISTTVFIQNMGALVSYILHSRMTEKTQ